MHTHPHMYTLACIPIYPHFANTSTLHSGMVSWKAIATDVSTWMQFHQLCVSISIDVESESGLFPRHAPEQSCLYLGGSWLCHWNDNLSVFYFSSILFFFKQKNPNTPRWLFIAHCGFTFFFLNDPNFFQEFNPDTESECNDGTAGYISAWLWEESAFGLKPLFFKVLMGLRDPYFQGLPAHREEAGLAEVGGWLSTTGLHWHALWTLWLAHMVPSKRLWWWSWD